MGSQDLQQARYDQLVRRVGALYGGGSKVTEVLPEVFPVLELEDTTPELIFLSGWRTATAATERPPQVALGSRSQLFNPVDSGVIAVVTQMWLNVNVATNIAIGLVTVPLVATGIPGSFRDGRLSGARQSTLVTFSVDGGSAPAQIRLILQIADQKFLTDPNGLFVLVPGTGVEVGSNIDNRILSVQYFWREREAQSSELNFP